MPFFRRGRVDSPYFRVLHMIIKDLYVLFVSVEVVEEIFSSLR